VAALARETNVALLPVGCVEMHGPHLPTGTDGFHAAAVCERAARIEPAIVLPTIFYNINDLMQGYPGTIHVSMDTLNRLYHEICLECARNGFSRILFFVSHGGSQTPIDQLQSQALERRTRTGRWDYLPAQVFITRLMAEEIEECYPKVNDGHGGPVESSWVLAARPDLVHLDRVTGPGPVNEPKTPLLRTRVPWIRQVPAGYKRDPRQADVAKGERMLDAAARRLADIIRAFKAFDPEKDC
jgi:creatinine amidohydrolase